MEFDGATVYIHQELGSHQFEKFELGVESLEVIDG